MGATGASIEELNDSKNHSYDVILSLYYNVIIEGNCQ